MGQYYATPQADHAAALSEQDAQGTQVLATYTPAAPSSPAHEAPATTPRRRGRPAGSASKAKATTPKSTTKRSATLKSKTSPQSSLSGSPKSTQSSPAKSSASPIKSDESIVAISEPADLRSCKVAELRALAAENGVKQTGTKYELIGRLLSLFGPEKLTEDALSSFTVAQLRTMGKGINAPQRATTRTQLLHALVAHARNEMPSPRTSTPQPSRRKRSASAAQLPQTERASRKRARTDKQ